MHHRKEGTKLILPTKHVLVFGLDKLSLQRQHAARKEFYQELAPWIDSAKARGGGTWVLSSSLVHHVKWAYHPDRRFDLGG
jgi:hypothetical protein